MKHLIVCLAVAPRFKCSSTQKRDCLMPWRASFNIPWKNYRTSYYSCLLNFHLRQIHFVLPPPLKKGKQLTDGLIKKESIHCFSMKIFFYEGRFSVTRTKRQSDSCYPPFPNFTFLYLSLHEGTPFGGKQRQYFTWCCSVKLALNIYNPLQCSSGSACLCGTETKGQKETGKALTHRMVTT